MQPDDLLRYAAELLDRLGLTFLVTGSTATIAYGEPRFTNDLDIVLDLPAGLVDQFCAGFPPDDFYLSREAVLDAVRTGFQFNVIHPAAGLKIDFILLSGSAFDASRRLRGRRLAVLADRTVPFASPEDVVLKKLLYFREGGSEKHLRDIAGVVRVQGAKLDYGYIAHWAAALGVADLWQQALDRLGGA